MVFMELPKAFDTVDMSTLWILLSTICEHLSAGLLI